MLMALKETKKLTLFRVLKHHSCECLFSGKELQFLLSHSGEKIFEVLRFKEESRSWFIEDSVQKGTCKVWVIQ